MRFILKILKDFPAYLWSGWGSLASIFLFLALWDLGNQLYGNLVLPSPKDTFITLFSILKDDSTIENVLITIKRAFLGFGISLAIGSKPCASIPNGIRLFNLILSVPTSLAILYSG